MLKGEGGISKFLQELTKDIRNGNTSARDQVKKFASLLINGSETCAQEAAAFLLGIPNTNCSRKDVFINTALPEERVYILKPQEELDELEDDSTEIRCKNLLDHYVLRPEELEDTCLAEFASMFERTVAPPRTTVNERKNRTQTFKLKKNGGFVRKRTTPKIIRYRHYGKKEDFQNYCREQLMLFVPWRDEKEDLLDIDHAKTAHRLHDLTRKNSKPYIFNQDIDDNVLADLYEEAEQFDDDEDASPLVDEELENLDGIEDAQYERMEETVKSKVQQFLPPRMVDDERFARLMRSLNDKQRRFVLDTLHLLKTSPSPFYRFLSGGAGVGKSHVITAIVQSFMRFYVKTPNINPDEICCVVSAPTGKAAFNVAGMTLHCTFKLPPNQYGGKLAKLEEGAANSLRLKLLRVKLFIIDEISMVSVRQLYEIDQRLKQIFCSSEDFGGTSILVVGHLRQLPPIGGAYVFKAPTQFPLGEIAGNYLWHKFQIYELDEIMRQKGELQFCKALNNMSEGVMDQDDIALIRSREVSDINQPPKNAIRLFQLNEECRIFNNEIHEELKTEGVTSTAYDKIQGVGSQKEKEHEKEYAKTLNAQKADGLPYTTHLQVAASLIKMFLLLYIKVM